MSTPMATERLDADLQGTPTDQTTYHRMIGGLMYLTASRPDIAFPTFVCARYQARPTFIHLKEVKRIFRYLRQSYNMGLWYPKDSGFELIAYSDVDHAGCKEDCKSTSEGLQFLGGKLVSWSLKKQDCTAMSTAEAEYVSLSACCAQVIWMHEALDIRYHFIKEHVEKGTVEIYFVGTEYQLADLFTKALPKERFEYLVHRIEMDLEHVQCVPNGKDKANLNKHIKNHPLRFSIAASSSVPWIYMAQFWHTLKERRFKDGINHSSADNAKDVFFVNNIHVDYAELLWEGIYYSPHHPTSSIPYPRFTKIIMIIEEMKHTEHYRMYAEVFGLDVPLTQSQLTESTQGMHRKPSAPSRRENVERSTTHWRLKEIGRWLEPRSDKESPEVESTNDKEVEVTNVVIPVNVNEEEDEITDEVECHLIPSDHLQEVLVRIYTHYGDNHINKEQVKKQVPEQLNQTLYVPEQQYQLYLSMKDNPQLQQQDIAIWIALQMKFENLQVPQTTCKPYTVRPRDHDDPYDDAHLEGENSAKRQKTSEYEAYVSGESSSRQVNKEERGPSTLGNQEQEDD
ncbi:hypothetical protein Tco_0923452 [Tanacetum coccineum]|uniref:Retrovirus-related Pol polyprotein from transposon TNT 1-94 n=1 Tax=Tanacetum coccineum TaxID=301880 RepID=A0ABQ5D3G2_9ASTR